MTTTAMFSSNFNFYMKFLCLTLENIKPIERLIITNWYNKNTLTGTANCKKTTRHHVHLSLYAKSRKTNDAKSRKWPKTSIWAIFLTISMSDISKLQIFLKNRFHSNWRSYLVLTSGQKPKKLLELFLRKISKCLILG